MSIDLYVFTFLAMLRFAPVEQLPSFPGHEESIPEAMARYGATAAAITDVCTTHSKQPRSCAALLVAIGTQESAFSKDASDGPCHRAGAYRTRCDSGVAAGPWQTHAHGSDDAGPVTIGRLFADHRLAARVTLRASRMCRHLPAGDQLAGLSGTCEPSPRHMKSARARYALWKRVEAWKP